MSENRVEVNSDNTNVSLEEQAKQQENVIAEGNENRVELDTDAKPTESRPEWLPEKFKSAEDLAKAYSELEKKQSAPTEEAPTESAATESITVKKKKKKDKKKKKKKQDS